MKGFSGLWLRCRSRSRLRDHNSDGLGGIANGGRRSDRGRRRRSRLAIIAPLKHSDDILKFVRLRGSGGRIAALPGTSARVSEVTSLLCVAYLVGYGTVDVIAGIRDMATARGMMRRRRERESGGCAREGGKRCRGRWRRCWLRRCWSCRLRELRSLQRGRIIRTLCTVGVATGAAETSGVVGAAGRATGTGDV